MARRGRPIPTNLQVQLQHLHARGWAIRGLARIYHLDRNTVRRYIRQSALPLRRTA
jgi:hypothetical protein